MKSKNVYINLALFIFLFGNGFAALPPTISSKELWEGVNT